jgi:hypothetical protein
MGWMVAGGKSYVGAILPVSFGFFDIRLESVIAVLVLSVDVVVSERFTLKVSRRMGYLDW